MIAVLQNESNRCFLPASARKPSSHDEEIAVSLFKNSFADAKSASLQAYSGSSSHLPGSGYSSIPGSANVSMPLLISKYKLDTLTQYDSRNLSSLT